MTAHLPDPRAIRALLFDLDGTLFDSFPVHFAAYQTLFAHYGLPFGEATFRATYSPNWRLTYEAVGLPRELWDEADRIWMEAAGGREPSLFPGARAALEQMAGAYHLGVVTAGNKPRVLGHLAHAGLDGLFATVITGDDVRAPKPAPEGLELALAALAVAPEQALYVGDTLADYEAARNAGMTFVGIPGSFAGFPPGLACTLVASLTDLAKLLGVG